MYPSLSQMFQETVARHGSREALRYKQDGAWHPITYQAYGQRVDRLACGLIELGVAFGDRVALLAENRPEWVIADQAILAVGGATVPIYPTLTGAQSQYIVNDCGARVVIVSSEKHLKKLLENPEGLAGVTHLVVMDDFQQPANVNPVFRFQDLVDLGARCADTHGQELARRRAELGDDTLASIVYTSGTTGEPKGAMLTHGNFASNVIEAVPIMGINGEDSTLSFLPLSHVFERIVNYAVVRVGGLNNYAESIDTVPANLLEVKPTYLVSVPRLFEKIRSRVFDKVAQDAPMRQKLFHWAMGVGREMLAARASGKPVHFGLALRHTVADRLVFSAVRERTGGRLRYCISGGAPLSAEVGEFFMIIGITIIEGYGLTETSPVITFNRPDDVRLGTVGRPLPNVEVRLAEDGELLVRGPNVMKGYHNQPEATALAIDADGWFHTGDIAQFDATGHVRIVDRKKEIIVMSNGKNVAPQPIENAIKGSRYVEQVMLVGDRRNFITALIVPNFEALKAFASEHRLGDDVAELIKHPQVIALYTQEVEAACETFAKYEKVKKFALLPREFDASRNEMTPTLKVKRRVVSENFAPTIESLYQSEAVSA